MVSSGWRAHSSHDFASLIRVDYSHKVWDFVEGICVVA